MYLFSVSDGDGLHWFFLCHRQQGHYEVFDSLGSNKLYIIHILKNLSGFCEFNETAVQASRSKSCGEFCVFYAIHRYFNEDLSLQEVLEEYFTANSAHNEEIVKRFLVNIRND